MRTAAAALNMAALRVNIESVLPDLNAATMRLLPQTEFALRQSSVALQYSGRTEGTAGVAACL
jgi:hypothetical protein